MNTQPTPELARAITSLEGLSVGDAFGQSFFDVSVAIADRRLLDRHAPAQPWFFTDDTVMARSIVRCLATHQSIDCDWLAAAFAKEYLQEPNRGYGGTARGILRDIADGKPWRDVAAAAFDAEGSCGNGGAMRAAPIGAYFADDLQAVCDHAKRSAVITHAHPDGQTGAIAVALAAAWIVMQGPKTGAGSYELIEFVLAHLPTTETYWRLKKALTLPLTMHPATVACILGNGSNVVSSDTVPFSLWCTCRHLDSYEDALWTAASVYGDMDTNCAIVGSLVVLANGIESIPREWRESREYLNL
jgi:ADP-ribosylglycohydrolase